MLTVEFYGFDGVSLSDVLMNGLGYIVECVVRHSDVVHHGINLFLKKVVLLKRYSLTSNRVNPAKKGGHTEDENTDFHTRTLYLPSPYRTACLNWLSRLVSVCSYSPLSFRTRPSYTRRVSQ